MEGKVVMSAKELRRARVLDQVLQGGMSLRQSSDALGVTYRHAERLKRRYAERGDALGPAWIEDIPLPKDKGGVRVWDGDKAR
jgi:hypothetical protein